jgi:hypothetical protein
MVKLFLKQMQQGSLCPVPTSMTRSHVLERHCPFVVNIDLCVQMVAKNSRFLCPPKHDNDRRTVCAVHGRNRQSDVCVSKSKDTAVK